MGIFASIDGLSFGRVTKDLVVMCADRSGKYVICLERSGNIEIRSDDGIYSSRQLNLIPTCCCQSPRGSWIIGFDSGTISEFDFELNLIQSFTVPGTIRAHSGSVVNVVPGNKDYESSDSLLFISAGLDNYVHFWNFAGNHISAKHTQSPVTAMCISYNIVYVAEKGNKVSAAEITERVDSNEHIETKGKGGLKVRIQHVTEKQKLNIKHRTITIPSNIKAMAPIPNYNGCLATLEDGQIIVLNEKCLVTTFQISNTHPCLSVAPINVNKKTGSLSYFVINSYNEMYSCVNEVKTKIEGTAIPVIAFSESAIFVVTKGEIIARDVRKLAKYAPKNQELNARKGLVEYIQKQRISD